jgi:hypothetical protein
LVSPVAVAFEVAPHGAAPDSVLVHLDGRVEPSGCAAGSFAHPLFAGDSIRVYLQMVFKRSCSRAARAFRFPLTLPSERPRTVAVSARGAGGTQVSTTVRLSLVP